jgi:pimeloyl-ACP methyl ester carboxylesterase
MTVSKFRASEDNAQAYWERFLRFRSEHPMKHTKFHGVEWEYIACGTGSETVLLLTGGLRVAETAFVLIQILEEDYRVIAPTYPPLNTMGAIVDGIAALLDVEHVREASVLGQSYGGAVAQVLLQRHPSRVRKLILSGTSPLIALRWKRGMSALLTALAGLLPKRVVKRTFRRILLPLVTVQDSARPFWDAYLEEHFQRRLTKADVLSHLRTTRDAQVNYAYSRDRKTSWRGDVLVIWGESDHLRTERGRKGILEVYPQAQIHVIAGGGHTVALEEPDTYAAIVRAFLERRE